MIQTLLSANEFLASGMPVSDDLRSEEVQAAIQSVEYTYIKEALTDEIYIELLEAATPLDEETDVILNGGIIDDKAYLGLKFAICNMVWAFRAMDVIRITRYSTVEKESEFSSRADLEQLNNQARVRWELGQAAVAEICAFYDLPDPSNHINGFLNTLLY